MKGWVKLWAYPLAAFGLLAGIVLWDLASTPRNAEGQAGVFANYIQMLGGTTGVMPSLIARGVDTNIDIQVTPKGSGNVTSAGNFVGAAKTDLTTVYPATMACIDSLTATPLIVIRAAANDWSLQRTAAGAETHNIVCFLTPLPTRTTSGKGYKLTAFSIIQQVTVAALTSNTFNALSTTTYVNNVADAVAAYGGSITITMPTATQANPYVTAGTVGTPAFMNTSAAGISLDWTVVMQNTGVYSLKGVVATWTTQD